MLPHSGGRMRIELQCPFSAPTSFFIIMMAKADKHVRQLCPWRQLERQCNEDVAPSTGKIRQYNRFIALAQHLQCWVHPQICVRDAQETSDHLAPLTASHLGTSTPSHRASNNLVQSTEPRLASSSCAAVKISLIARTTRTSLAPMGQCHQSLRQKINHHKIRPEHSRDDGCVSDVDSHGLR